MWLGELVCHVSAAQCISVGSPQNPSDKQSLSWYDWKIVESDVKHKTHTHINTHIKTHTHTQTHTDTHKEDTHTHIYTYTHIHTPYITHTRTSKTHEHTHTLTDTQWGHTHYYLRVLLLVSSDPLPLSVRPSVRPSFCLSVCLIFNQVLQIVCMIWDMLYNITGWAISRVSNA